MTGLLILLAAALAGTGCYNLSCAFVDVPTAQTSRMMMRARKQTGTSNEKLFDVYLTKIAGKLAPLLRLDPIKRGRLALTLSIAGIPLTPECYTMKAFLTAFATGLLSVPFFMIMPLMGLLAGSITLSGGHGTGAAWSKLFIERYGFTNATEVAMACATFGLVLGGLIGGPGARYLVKHSTTPNGIPDDQEVPTAFEKPDVGRMITSLVLIETIALIAICLTVGKIVAQLLAGTAFELPTFVCVLFVGVILSNGLSMMGFYRVFERAVSVLGNVSLSLFLAMALMGLKLWELASLALPMLAILVVQTIFMALYAIFVTWRMMGKNYDAAVLAAGHCGFGLGATPTAIANMQAITERFGPSHMAFLVVPMVGAFFIDIVNALVIKLYLMLPIFAG